MKVIETKEALIETLKPYKAGRISVGFVPTMGALHAGHVSLVEQSRKEAGITVASIFVNPTQFNDKNDFAKYPRTLFEDIEKLSSVGCDFVFSPGENEMYPEEDSRVFDFGVLDKVMEGAYRPGHFNGVAQIVSRLFDAVRPDKAYFGEKDFQQLAIIRRLTEMANYPVQIIGCPIVRENDGLAMSSRNIRLTSEQRRNASSIYAALVESKEKITSVPFEEIKNRVIARIDQIPEQQTEYFEIADRKTLQPATQYKENSLQGCVAVRVGNVRLIDNIAY